MIVSQLGTGLFPGLAKVGPGHEQSEIGGSGLKEVRLDKQHSLCHAVSRRELDCLLVGPGSQNRLRDTAKPDDSRTGMEYGDWVRCQRVGALREQQFLVSHNLDSGVR